MNIDDISYNNIVEDILKNKEFKKLKEMEHHGTNRYVHSLRVSYYSYILARMLFIDYYATARAGLLHDFFFSAPNRSKLERLKSTFVHPSFALQNSLKYYNLTDKEQNIIKSHMFPIYICLPKYLESWIVSIVDKIVGTYEFCLKFKIDFKYAVNFMIVIILSKIR